MVLLFCLWSPIFPHDCSTFRLRPRHIFHLRHEQRTVFLHLDQPGTCQQCHGGFGSRQRRSRDLRQLFGIIGNLHLPHPAHEYAVRPQRPQAEFQIKEDVHCAVFLFFQPVYLVALEKIVLEFQPIIPFILHIFHVPFRAFFPERKNVPL